MGIRIKLIAKITPLSIKSVGTGVRRENSVPARDKLNFRLGIQETFYTSTSTTGLVFTKLSTNFLPSLLGWGGLIERVISFC